MGYADCLTGTRGNMWKDEVGKHPVASSSDCCCVLQDQQGEPRNPEVVLKRMEELRNQDGKGTIEAKLRNYKAELDFKTGRGWTQADAEAHLCLTGVVGASLAKALEEGSVTGSSRFAASTYALYMSLQRGALIDEKLRSAAGISDEVPPPPVYHHILGGTNSASERSERILTIDTPDKYEFTGFTCMAELHGYDDPELFTDDNEFQSRGAYDKGKPTYVLNKGDVLKIVSEKRCESTKTLRAVVHCTPDGGYRVPPNALITLKKVHKRGEWVAYGKRPDRRCIEVGISYRVLDDAADEVLFHN